MVNGGWVAGAWVGGQGTDARVGFTKAFFHLCVPGDAPLFALPQQDG